MNRLVLGSQLVYVVWIKASSSQIIKRFHLCTNLALWAVAICRVWSNATTTSSLDVYGYKIRQVTLTSKQIFLHGTWKSPVRKRSQQNDVYSDALKQDFFLINNVQFLSLLYNNYVFTYPSIFAAGLLSKPLKMESTPPLHLSYMYVGLPKSSTGIGENSALLQWCWKPSWVKRMNSSWTKLWPNRNAATENDADIWALIRGS